MLATAALLISLTKPSDTVYVITGVQEKLVFAGRLGHRVITSIDVEGAGNKAHITISDIRHDRFVPYRSMYKSGESVTISSLGMKKDSVLASSQIHRVK